LEAGTMNRNMLPAAAMLLGALAMSLQVEDF
jgi:hypothetical protein